MIRCVVIDDEPLARQLIVSYIDQVAELTYLGGYDSPVAALANMQSHTIDAVFLDIDMPGINGIDFARSFKHMPKVIFITAHAEFAVQAFDIAAVDYLVKPVSFERFVQAVQKLIQPGVREEEQNKQVPASCIFIKVDKRLVKVDYASIRYIEAMGDYLKVRTTDSTLISYMPIGKMESLLPSSRFIRIHRSTIVHLNFIEYIEGNVVVIGGEHLAIGLTYREELMKRLNG